MHTTGKKMHILAEVNSDMYCSPCLVAEDLERSGIFDDNDSDIVKNPRRKILTNDELAEIQAKKGKKKNDYNLD